MQPSTSDVIGQCTDPYRGCIVSTMVPSDWDLSNVPCDSISVFSSHIYGRTKRHGVYWGSWPSSNRDTSWTNTNNDVKEKKGWKKEDIFIRRASSGKNAAAAMKRLPKARVRGGKRKREKRRRQKYQTRSSHTRRRAVPILNAVEMDVPWLEIKLSFLCWGFSDRKSLGNDNFGRERNGKIGGFGVVWCSIELMDRQRQFRTIDSYFLAEYIHVQLLWH